MVIIMELSENVTDNIDYIKKTYQDSSDVVSRKIKKKRKKLGYVYLESVSSDDKISEFLNKSIILHSSITNMYENLKNSIYNSHISTCDNFDSIFYFIIGIKF